MIDPHGHPERDDSPVLTEARAHRGQLAVSNIAWDRAEDDVVAGALVREGVRGVEIAPTTRWERPLDAPAAEVDELRRTWENRGLPIVALQALLYGQAQLQLFGSEPAREELAAYLYGVIELGARLGAKRLVFGSPRNRLRGSLPLAEAWPIAVDFFRDVGGYAAEHGLMICIEANPPEYGCDFITTTAEALALCTDVASPGIGVNGDLGGMTLAGEDPRATIASLGARLAHFHISEPQLAEPGASADHERAAAGLAEAGYAGWVSIEMRAASGSNVERVERAVRFAKSRYT